MGALLSVDARKVEIIKIYFSKLTDQKMQIKASFGGYYRTTLSDDVL